MGQSLGGAVAVIAELHPAAILLHGPADDIRPGFGADGQHHGRRQRQHQQHHRRPPGHGAPGVGVSQPEPQQRVPQHLPHTAAVPLGQRRLRLRRRLRLLVRRVQQRPAQQPVQFLIGHGSIPSSSKIFRSSARPRDSRVFTALSVRPSRRAISAVDQPRTSFISSTAR